MDIAIRQDILTSKIFKGLRNACGMTELEDELVERAIASSLFTLSAESGGRMIGMVRMVGDGAFVFLICDLLVVPLWRRRGVGSRLVEEAVKRAKTFVPQGRAVVISLFSAEGREGFYTRLGFTELPSSGLGAGMQYFFV
jgi:GNAT superfamily N-acetyltransferase